MTQLRVAPPHTAVEPVTEILHGIAVTDPYRWLEDQNSPRTRKWLEAQAAYTQQYLNTIPAREQISKRIRELLGCKDASSEPWNVGDRYIFLKRRDKSEQPVIAMREGLNGAERVLIDPAESGTENSVAVGIASVSYDGRFLAYSIRHGGTDHCALKVFDIENNMVLPDGLAEGFCTSFVFAADGSGFYYSHRELRDPHPNYRAAFWHRFGTDRSQDQEVFFAGEEPNLFLGILHWPEAELLAYVVFSLGIIRRTSIHLQRLPIDSSRPELLLGGIEGCFVPFSVGRQLLAYTDVSAPNFRVVRIDLDHPQVSHWHDVVPETHRRIQQFAAAGGHAFVTRADRFSTSVEAFEIDGGRSEMLAFPPYMTIDLLNRNTSSSTLLYAQTSISEPLTTHSYAPQSGRVSRWEDSVVRVELPAIAVEELEYRSKDGTSIPIFIAARKDLLHSGPLPAFLTGYGGFGSCVTPRFSAFATFLIELGFLFAVPALRGGSELGAEWHRAGKRQCRQNSFDDFIAAAEWLIAQERVVAGRIAIGGGSNAGLLIGAVITQRADLFRAAICLGPLLDMMRYHKFDFAKRWVEEFGSSEDKQDFHSLLGYSPYQRVLDSVDYPAVLFISGDSDTRCNPMHARKMTARLQAASGSGLPVLLDYKVAWGHTPVQPFSVKVDALTDRLAFVCHELGVPLEARS